MAQGAPDNLTASAMTIEHNLDGICFLAQAFLLKLIEVGWAKSSFRGLHLDVLPEAQQCKPYPEV